MAECSKSPPEIKLKYHPNGEIAEVNISLPMPRISSTEKQQSKRKRSRLDSGFDDDSSVIETENRLGDVKEDVQLEFQADQQAEKDLKVKLVKTRTQSYETDSDGDFITSAQPMLESDNKFSFNRSGEYNICSVLGEHSKLLLVSIIVLLLLGLVGFVIFHFLEVRIEPKEYSNDSSVSFSKKGLSSKSNFNLCSPECFEKSKTLLSVANGQITCRNNTFQVECRPGFQLERYFSWDCERQKKENLKKIKCLPTKCKDREEADCETGVLILAGGEYKGILSDSIETFPFYSSCQLPKLPQPLKWASFAFMGNSLVVCGGQNSSEQPSRNCWALDTGRQWRWFGDLVR